MNAEDTDEGGRNRIFRCYPCSSVSVMHCAVHPKSLSADLFRKILLFLVFCGVCRGAGQKGEWPVYGGDAGGSKYSALAQINKTNVEKLKVAWKWNTGEQSNLEQGTTPGQFEGTPLMIGDVLYLSTPYNRVVALDPNTGQLIWDYDPRAYDWGQPPISVGFVHRGVASWSDGRQHRIFFCSRWRLIALNAATGNPIPEFGKNGEVDLTEALGWKGEKRHFGSTSPPVVYKDLVIMGNSISDRLVYRDAPPGDILAFNVRTGKLVWRFHTIPRKDEFGNDTWEGDSWQLTGHVNVWPPFILDEKRGLLYLAVTTPANDFYGGDRKGDNLFADSLLCLNANTGRRVWHFQTVHHGVWDFDGVMTPNLVTLRVSGKKVEAVAAVSKTGFTYVFERTTGKPIWPIDERSVPQSEVPGERTSRTQPFPTKPPPFAKQGFTVEDVIDFTPELKAMALEKLRNFRMGPIFTPPAVEAPTVQMPGVQGGANWGGASFDPETGTLYVKATNWPSIVQLQKPEPGTVAATYFQTSSRNFTLADGLPFHKPPYGVVTAIDLNRGEHVWQTAVGDMPGIREHPLLKGLNLPLLGSVGHSGLIVTRGGLLFISCGDSTFYALDKKNGSTLWQADLGSKSEATPMTYQTRSGRQFVVIATGAGKDAALVAFALPERWAARQNYN